jgi:hypothetical protein
MLLRLKVMDTPEVMAMTYSGVSSVEGDQSCCSFVCAGSLVAVTVEMVKPTSINTSVLRLLFP